VVCSNEDDLQNVIQNITRYVYTDPKRGTIGFGVRGDVFVGYLYPLGVGRGNPARLVVVKVIRDTDQGPKAKEVRSAFPESWHAD